MMIIGQPSRNILITINDVDDDVGNWKRIINIINDENKQTNNNDM